MFNDSSGIRELAVSLYGDIPGGALQCWRPFICPFQPLLDAVPTGARILDVGCGSGLFLGLLAASGRISAGVGFDANAPAIERANRMRRKLNENDILSFERRDAAAGWPEGEFDVISIIDVMHHVAKTEQERLIRTAASRLKEGGILIYKDMVRRPWWRAGMNRLHDLLFARQWIHYAPIEEVGAWMTAAGVRPQELRAVDMYWYGHEIIVARKESSYL